MLLSDVVQGVPGLPNWTHAQKIKFFAWYLHTKKNQERFNPSEIRACYNELHLQLPSNVNPYIANLVEKKEKEVLRDKQGYRLAKAVRDEFDKKYGQRTATVQVDKLLSDLPGKISDEAERVFLTEALTCFRSGAFRAAIVMTWNLAYYHLEEWILKNHLAAFNTKLPLCFQKYKDKPITSQEDFSNVKEGEVIDVCRSANIISADVKKIMKEKLDKRNSAAHPSLVTITQIQAEDFITDLVNNVVLKLA